MTNQCQIFFNDARLIRIDPATRLILISAKICSFSANQGPMPVPHLRQQDVTSAPRELWRGSKKFTYRNVDYLPEANIALIPIVENGRAIGSVLNMDRVAKLSSSP